MCGSSYLPARRSSRCAPLSVGRFRHRVAWPRSEPWRRSFARGKTGRGQKVEGALLRTAIAFNNPTLIEQQAIQVDRVATVNRGQTSAPADLFRTRDGWIVALGDRRADVPALGQAHGRGSLARPIRASRTTVARGDNGEIISKRMAEWCGRAHDRARRSPSSRTPGFRRARSTRRSRRSTTRTSARPVCLRDTEYPGVARGVPLAPTPVDLSETPGRFQPPGADAGRAHRRDPDRARLSDKRRSPSCGRGTSSDRLKATAETGS